MFLIDTSREGQAVYDPIVNQSLDNYLVNDLRLPGHGLMVYINQPAVIIGVHQNAYQEVDLPYLHDHHIKLVRRSSGGGAVYHDYGNLVFENIMIDTETHFGDYNYFAEPILRALHEMGVKGAQLHGRNDLVINQQKFSGMTMFQVGNSAAAGGTLLFDLNQSVATRVLTPDQSKLASKGIASVQARVTNLKPFLDEPYASYTPEQFRTALLQKIFRVSRLDEIETYHLSAKDWKIIDQRLAGKYRTEAWNYGTNPGFKYYVSQHFPIGTVSFNYSLTDQRITALKIFGDFISKGNLHQVEQALLGVPLQLPELIQALQRVDLTANLGAVSAIDLAQLLLQKTPTILNTSNFKD
ncbi:lipoate--protein ligase [Lactobacillus sp. DCY120]|uniref:lipoate--protein ligase n=1 Tax=Bombilactobacillus apium TaxID=2675299 RepID=A0A850QYI5_9LACO|nr:lipoate--protein ligase [Bombilactobacillus apium]NVY95733.1 lipoate--protein ligase [Bombilactobacillus apium]